MRWYLLLLVLFLIFPIVFAEDQVVINSKEWQDVALGLLYARLMDIDANFIIEEAQGVQLYREILNTNLRDVLLVESDNNFITGYEALLRNRGFNVERVVFSNPYETNLWLAERVISKLGIDSFIVLNDEFGYNTVSVAPYALLTNSFILYASKHNINSIYDFLKKNAKRVIIYGHVDREVKKKLVEFNPDIINTGDKYLDNINLVKMFLNKRPTNQIIMTNGEVLEPGLFNNEFPVLLIGTSNIPHSVLDFIVNSDISASIVVGYDLFTSAKKIRDETGIKVLLKFGQGRNEQMYALAIFPLPAYSPKVSIIGVRYNMASGKLEVIYENQRDVATYVQSLSHTLFTDANETIASVGDKESFFLDGNEIKALTYDIDLTEHKNEHINVESKILLGNSPGSLDKLLTQKSEVQIISFEDNSQIRVKAVVYNKQRKWFEVLIENIGESTVYVDPEIVGLIIDGEETTIGSEPQAIGVGDQAVFLIRAELEDVDFKDNPRVTLKVRFGKREGILINSLTQEFEFKVKSFDYWLISTAVVAFVLLLLIVLLLTRNKITQRF